ncbi:MAG TPA: serine hydrolase [Vicinamibacterales bacterium]|nr:serine hydrolase [Vicinamibacterales bacterium]
MPIYRTSKFVAIRLTILGLGMTFIATGAAATTLQQPVAPTAASAKAATTTARAKPSAAARARARAARIRAARAKAARSARALAEAKRPQYRTDASGNVVPDVRAAAAIIYDPATGKILYEENAMDERSIASITKVMTAIVFLESATDLNQEVTIVRSDTFRASTTYLKTNDRVRVSDLLHLLLIPSDNAAARALARISPLGSDGFIARMNSKADDLGLHQTAYTDPSGLLNDNISSAYDMARLIAFASEDDRIGPIMRTPEYSFRTAKNRLITIRSTNQILRAGDIDVLGGKTGFISKAGYCLATLLKMPQGGPSLAVVVLGASSSVGRFWETRHLMAWLSAHTGLFGIATPSVATAQ